MATRVEIIELNSIPEPNSGCWLWLHRHGYKRPRAWDPVEKRQRFASQISYEAFKGLVTDHVLHTCDNPECVNPEHLYLGSNAQNVVDRLARNLGARGEKIACSKLKPDDVLDILKREKPVPALAEQYGVGESAIRDIINGKTWKHVARTRNLNLVDQIADLLRKNGDMSLHDLAVALFLDEKSWRYPSKGGSPGCFMSLRAAIKRGKFVTVWRGVGPSNTIVRRPSSTAGGAVGVNPVPKSS